MVRNALWEIMWEVPDDCRKTDPDRAERVDADIDETLLALAAAGVPPSAIGYTEIFVLEWFSIRKIISYFARAA